MAQVATMLEHGIDHLLTENSSDFGDFAEIEAIGLAAA